MRTVIVDDEILNLKNLEIILNENFPQIDVLGMFQNVAEAKLFIEKTPIDLLFLDVSMPIEDGFDLLAYFPVRNFQTIFVTAHEEYAIKALRVGATDYILKPILIAELKSAIESVKVVLNTHQTPNENTLVLNYEGGKSIIAIDEIQYLKGLDNLTIVYLSSNRKIMVSKTLKHFEEILQKNFFRIHKSFLVNLKFASKILSRETLFLELQDGTQLPISRRNYKLLNDIIKSN
ncbi:LytTR family DNA-binding domain-containing protein [Flavobacterium sp.]|uniref:LytR/AlgR family response regulator transcription factor n=1 Tax=Flavobacterium sp. TaxID=239 RepID=UPI00286ACED7|nr:LytTR family DNA-binding domain-containing protein [Flavobacterium sp.]